MVGFTAVIFQKPDAGVEAEGRQGQSPSAGEADAKYAPAASTAKKTGFFILFPPFTG